MLTPIEEKNQGEMTDARRRQILGEAKAMMADGVATGLKRALNTACSLHNVKVSQAYKLEGFPNWTSYCEAIDINRQYSYEQLAVAKRLTAEIPGADPSCYIFLQADIQSLYKASSAYFRSLTFKEIVALSKKVDAFSLQIKPDDVLGLLPGKQDPTDEGVMASNAQRSEHAEYNAYMRDVCKQRGWKWNAKDNRCEHQDGTPCTDEELGHITMPDDAMRVWETAVQLTHRMIQKAMETIERHGPSYIRYAKAIRNDDQTKRIMEARETIRQQTTALDAMLENLFAFDMDSVKKIKKEGISL